MFKKYIKSVVKEEINRQILKNTLNKTHVNNWQTFYEEQVRYTEKLVNEKEKNIEELKDQIEKLRFSNFSLCEKIEYLNNELLRITLENHNQQENKKLKEKLVKISNVVNSYNTNELTFYSLMHVMNDIENILKES